MWLRHPQGPQDAYWPASPKGRGKGGADVKKESRKQLVGNLVLNRETLKALGSDKDVLKHVAAANSQADYTCTVSHKINCP
jgi:hypothetical protein